MGWLPPLQQVAAVLGLVLMLAHPGTAETPVKRVAGPVVGAPLAREAGIWLRLDGPAEVVLESFPEAHPERVTRSSPVAADPIDGWSVRLIAGPLQPGTRHRYRILANGTELALPGTASFVTAPDWRERQPPPDATFMVLGSHAAPDPHFDQPYRPAGGGFELFSRVAAANPDFLLWVGSQAHLRPGDWDSALAHRERITQARQTPELAALLAGTGNLAVLAPGDFGPPGAGAWWPAADAARAAHRRAWPLPASFPPDSAQVRGLFRWSDAVFLFIDVASSRNDHRTPARRTLLGPEQVAWLLDALEQTPATFRFIVSGAPLLAPVDEPGFGYHAREERQALIDGIGNRELPGVILLAGGPAGEATRSVRARGYDLHEFVAGPSTARPAPPPPGLNYFRMPGTLVQGRHALRVSIHGPEDDRRATVSSVAADGTHHWSIDLAARQLR